MDTHPNTAFAVKKFKQPSLLKNLLGIQPKENALIAINNLLATANLATITSKDIQSIACDYGVDLRKSFLPELHAIYREFLLHCLTDTNLSQQELEELRSLKMALSLTDEEVRKINQELTGGIYRMEVEKALRDRRLTEEEKSYLREMQLNLKISDALAEKIYQETSGELLQKYMSEALADNLLTEKEEEELEEIKRSLEIELTLEGSARANYEKAKLFWQIENGKLPKLVTDLLLDSEEYCHYYTNAEWLEQKISKKLRESYLMRLSAGNDSRWRMENREMKPELEDIWATMDNGKVYITNNKVILSGHEGERRIPLTQILGFTSFKNGINVATSEKNIFIQFKNHIDVFTIILKKTITLLESKSGKTRA